MKVGRQGLGAVGMALNTNRELAQLLKEYGGEEQQQAPDGWQRGRRRATWGGEPWRGWGSSEQTTTLGAGHDQLLASGLL